MTAARTRARRGPVELNDVEQRLVSAVAEQVHGNVSADLTPADMERAVQALVAALPKNRHTSAEILGPFYDTAGLMSWLGISRQAVHQRVRDRKLIAVPTTDRPRRTLYPSWQFRHDGSVVPGVAHVLQALAPAGWSEITIAAWFMGPGEDLDGLSASQWLLTGRSVQDVVASAQRDVAAWLR